MTIALDEPTSPQRARRLPWEVIEVVGVGLLASAVLLGVFSVASGIAYRYSVVGEPSSPAEPVGPSIVAIVQRSTAWASPTVAFLVLVALGAAWWQVEGRRSVIAGPGNIDADVAEGELTTAFGHLLRARVLATAAVAFLVVLLVAALVQLGSTIDLYSGEPARAVTFEYIDEVGATLSTLALGAVAGFAGLRLRGSVSAALADADEGDTPDLDDDEEDEPEPPTRHP